jgi:predicted small lipoprotein YifL
MSTDAHMLESRCYLCLRGWLLAVCLAVTLSLAACGGKSPIASPVAGETPDGTVDMSQVQAAYIASGGGGSGTLFYRGRAYPFTVGGVGIGGIGASTMEASGEVYHLRDVAQFPGAYAQGRYGFVVGTTSGGDLWLQNESGVIMHLHAKRTGLMLSLGGDAVVISMSR